MNSPQTLWDAIEDSDRDHALALIGTMQDVNALNQDGESALHFASMYGDLEITRALVAAGADLEIGDDEGNTPLHWAAAAGQFDQVRLLVEAGARVQARNAAGLTPGARSGHDDIASYLAESSR